MVMYDRLGDGGNCEDSEIRHGMGNGELHYKIKGRREPDTARGNNSS